MTRKTTSKKTAFVKPPYLDSEEEAIMESYFRGEYIETPESRREAALIRSAAREFVDQMASNIQLTLPKDSLTRLKRKARTQGVPYQAFMAHVLNQYAQGALVPSHK